MDLCSGYLFIKRNTFAHSNQRTGLFEMLNSAGQNRADCILEWF